MPGSFKHGYALDIHGRDDVLRCNSSVSVIDETVIGDLIQFFVPASDGSVYCFGSAGSIYAMSGAAADPVVTFVYNDENGAIKGAAEWKLSDGNNYLFWATNTSVARALMNGALDTPWAAGVSSQDWKTSLAAVGENGWHTMKSAAGVLLIANAESLAEVDFDGNFTASALNVRPGNLLRCLEERDDFVILGSERKDNSEEGHLWSWITTALNYVQKRKYPIKGINSLLHTELPLLQGGSGGELFLSDFSNVFPIATIPGGGKTQPGGVAIENDLASFGIYGGTYPGIWQYGRRGSQRPQALTYPYRLNKTVGGSTVSTIGAVADVNGVLYASWGTTDGSTSDYGIDGVSSTTKANALYEGLEFDGGKTYLKKKFDTVKLVMTPLPAGTSVSVKFKTDKASTGGDSSAGAGWRYAVTGGGATTFSAAGAVEAIFNIGDAANIFEVGVELNASGADTPEIHALTTYLADEPYEYA